MVQGRGASSCATPSLEGVRDALEGGREVSDSFEILYDRAMAAERMTSSTCSKRTCARVIRMNPIMRTPFTRARLHARGGRPTAWSRAKDPDRERRTSSAPYRSLHHGQPGLGAASAWGEVAQALKHLQTAYGARPDPEIRAHCGEVLWSNGKRDEAQKIWRAALTENPATRRCSR